MRTRSRGHLAAWTAGFILILIVLGGCQANMFGLEDESASAFVYAFVTIAGTQVRNGPSATEGYAAGTLKENDVVRLLNAEDAVKDGAGNLALPDWEFIEIDTPYGYLGYVPTKNIKLVDSLTGRLKWATVVSMAPPQTRELAPRVTPFAANTQSDTLILIARFELEELLGEISLDEFPHTRTPDGRISVERSVLDELIERYNPGAVWPPESATTPTPFPG